MKYKCLDCKIDTRKGKSNFYMVTDELWEKFGAGQGMLCLSCFRERLGRNFQKEDFNFCVVNYIRNPFVKEIVKPTKFEQKILLEKNTQ